MSTKLNLPGQFNSYPKGSKPAHYAPHAQRTVESTFKSFAGRATHALTDPASWQSGIGRRSAPGKDEIAAARETTPRQFNLKGETPMEYPGTRNWNIREGAIKGSRGDSDPFDPYGGYYFALEISADGASTEVAHFLECSGLKTSSQVFEIQEGGQNYRVHKMPGQSKWDNIVLKYATSASTFLLEWRDAYLQDQFDKRKRYSGSIALMDNAGKVLRRYHFTDAWPVSWEGPSLSAGSSDLAVETLEIAHSGVWIDKADWSVGSAR
jgi:phage tail-like protein